MKVIFLALILGKCFAMDDPPILSSDGAPTATVIRSSLSRNDAERVDFLGNLVQLPERLKLETIRHADLLFAFSGFSNCYSAQDPKLEVGRTQVLVSITGLLRSCIDLQGASRVWPAILTKELGASKLSTFMNHGALLTRAKMHKAMHYLVERLEGVVMLINTLSNCDLSSIDNEEVMRAAISDALQKLDEVSEYFTRHSSNFVGVRDLLTTAELAKSLPLADTSGTIKSRFTQDMALTEVSLTDLIRGLFVTVNDKLVKAWGMMLSEFLSSVTGTYFESREGTSSNLEELNTLCRQLVETHRVDPAIYFTEIDRM